MTARQLKTLLGQYETIIKQLEKRLAQEKTIEDIDLLNHYRNRYFNTIHRLEDGGYNDKGNEREY